MLAALGCDLPACGRSACGTCPSRAGDQPRRNGPLTSQSLAGPMRQAGQFWRDNLARLAERTPAVVERFERLRSQAAVTDRRDDQAVRAGGDGWCSRMMIKRAARQGWRLSDKVAATGCRRKYACQRGAFELDAFGVLRKLQNSAVRSSRLRHYGARALKMKSVCS